MSTYSVQVKIQIKRSPVQARAGGINGERGELFRAQVLKVRMVIGGNHMHGQIGVLHDEDTTFNKRSGNHGIAMAMTLSFKHSPDHPDAVAGQPWGVASTSC